MKKQLALATMAVLAVSTTLTYAATPILNLDNALKGTDLNFGYTQSQNITVKGFQSGSGDSTDKEFVVTSPLLKDANDVDVEEYSILVAKKSISSYKTLSGALSLTDFDETKHTLTQEDKATNEVKLQLNAKNFEADTNYYGVIVPQDDNVQEGNHSTEFCFNVTSEKYAEGEDCKTFGQSVETQEQAPTETEADSDQEHPAAGADMRLADISHTISKDNKVTLTWKALAQSANVEIQMYDTATDEFIKLATVPMTQEKFEYQAKATDQELIFNFIPRDEKGKEIRYEVNARTETEVTPEIKKVPKVGPVEDMMLIVAITVLAYAGYRLLASNKAE